MTLLRLVQIMSIEQSSHKTLPQHPTILVTRPSLFAKALCEKIKAWGGKPVSFPTIDISTTDHSDLLGQQLQTLHQYDIIIFASRPAVLYGMEIIRQYWSVLPTLIWAAIGPGTQAELAKQGIESVLCPASPPYESESLLALPEFQPSQIAQKKILILRGNGGRALLEQSLTARAAKVTLIEAYQRTLPTQQDRARLSGFLATTSIDIVIVTSPYALTNLKKLVCEKTWFSLRNCTYITVGLRSYALAATFNIQNRILADGASDENILHVLTHLRDSNG